MGIYAILSVLQPVVGFEVLETLLPHAVLQWLRAFTTKLHSN